MTSGRTIATRSTCSGKTARASRKPPRRNTLPATQRRTVPSSSTRASWRSRRAQVSKRYGWVWNWGSKRFGYRDRESLFTYFGREAERFDGKEIYGNNARYLG